MTPIERIEREQEIQRRKAANRSIADHFFLAKESAEKSAREAKSSLNAAWISAIAAIVAAVAAVIALFN